jgi:hypothetical protein
LAKRLHEKVIARDVKKEAEAISCTSTVSTSITLADCVFTLADRAFTLANFSLTFVDHGLRLGL